GRAWRRPDAPRMNLPPRCSALFVQGTTRKSALRGDLAVRCVIEDANRRTVDAFALDGDNFEELAPGRDAEIEQRPHVAVDVTVGPRQARAHGSGGGRGQHILEHGLEVSEYFGAGPHTIFL